MNLSTYISLEREVMSGGGYEDPWAKYDAAEDKYNDYRRQRAASAQAMREVHRNSNQWTEENRRDFETFCTNNGICSNCFLLKNKVNQQEHIIKHQAAELQRYHDKLEKSEGELRELGAAYADTYLADK